MSPAEAAATLLETAVRIDGLRGRSVLDLGCGTGRLAIGAALLGARPVRGLDEDVTATNVAKAAARAEGVQVSFETADVTEAEGSVDLVVMNPPFGAQRKHADRPFWDRAFALARLSIYAFALQDSRTFIARQAVAHQAHILEVVPVPWPLGRTLPHHGRPRVDLDVDLWALRTGNQP